MDYIEFTGTPGDSPCVANDNLGPKGGCAEKILAIHATFCEQAIKPHSVMQRSHCNLKARLDEVLDELLC